MSMSVDVHLLSGKRASVDVEADASVESLRRRAQTALMTPGRGRLLNSCGEVLDGAQTIKQAKLKSGDVLALHVNQVQIKAMPRESFRPAFAALLGDGSVITWGDADCGGDSTAVQEQLRDVQQIQASCAAFAAILGDGSGVMPTVAATALPCRSSCEMCSRSKLRVSRLLQSWAMDP